MKPITWNTINPRVLTLQSEGKKLRRKHRFQYNEKQKVQIIW